MSLLVYCECCDVPPSVCADPTGAGGAPDRSMISVSNTAQEVKSRRLSWSFGGRGPISVRARETPDKSTGREPLALASSLAICAFYF